LEIEFGEGVHDFKKVNAPISLLLVIIIISGGARKIIEPGQKKYRKIWRVKNVKIWLYTKYYKFSTSEKLIMNF